MDDFSLSIDPFSITTIISGGFGLFLLYQFLRKHNKHQLPSPPGWPIFGHSIDFFFGVPIQPSTQDQPEYIGHFMIDIFTKYRKKLGGIFSIYPFIGYQCIVVNDAKYLKHILASSKAKNYIKSQSAYSTFGPILGGGLVVLEGRKWKFHRSIMSPLFRFEKLRTYAYDIFLQVIQEETQTLQERIRATPSGKLTLDAMELFRQLTLKIIAKATLGISNEGDDRIAQLMDIYGYVIAEINIRVWHPYRKFLPNEANREYNRRLNELDTMILEMIEQRQQELQHQAVAPQRDLLDLMIASQEEETGKQLTNEEILCEVKTFMLAGHETSSMWLAYATHMVAQFPKVRDKVYTECQQVVEGVESDQIPYENLAKLDYTTKVLKETLRWMPIVPIIAKYSAAEDFIDGYRIPSNCTVMIDIWGAHHDKRYWGDDVQQFIPERFEENYYKDTPTQPHACSFLPFGLGPRNCLGQNFAYLEAKLVMAIFMTKFKFSIQDTSFKTMDRYDIPMHPKDGIQIIVEELAQTPLAWS